MVDAKNANERRKRRLDQMNKIGSVAGASRALTGIWEAGRKRGHVVLRTALIQVPGGQRTLTRLVLPKGVALRFYLLSVFEAHCRLDPGEPWNNVRPLSGRGSWSDLVAIDGAYDAKSGKYMRDTDAGRTLEDLRLRQVQGALRTLEELGPEQGLVAMPRGSREQRLYQSFSLMKESGRGGHQTPDTYTVPESTWSAETITIPSGFFLNGWVQVLSPSEIATWLILRGLSQWAPNAHSESGVYLYGEARLQQFGLRRDAWEDGCQRLRDFGLIRFADTWEQFILLWGREKYQPHRYQVISEGFDADAMKKVTKELTIRQKGLNDATKRRARKPEPGNAVQ
ncbi:hypothetical protein ACIQNV_37210 [Streptomyces hydrogenans]|uniref:hypothetical protein n=1 Tax=Streptomyces hydrogenans TaxID=1873719 RepID=UPI003817D022